MKHLCKDSEFSDLGKFWKISKVKIHMQFFFISCKLEFILLIRIQKKNLKTDILGRKTVFLDLKIVENFRGILENSMLQDLPYPQKSMCTNFQLDFSKTPQKCVSPKKIISPKKCLFQKKFNPEKQVLPQNCVFIKKSVSPEKRVSPEKMFHLKNLTNPKKFLRECNIYVRIPNFLTSENFGKFLR